MAIKLSGLISGMDTDAMIDELVSAYSTRKDSYVKEQKALEYKQDAWKEMNTKIYSLFSGKLSSLRFSSAYSVKSVKASNANKVTVSGSSSAVNGTQELKITSLAKSGYLTGGVISATDGSSLKGSSKLSELGVESAGNITLKVNGKETAIEVTGDMTINNLVTKLKDAGVNASFDENNQRFFVSSKNSGVENDFSLTGDNATGTEVLKSLGLYAVTATDIKAYEDFIKGADTDNDDKITDAEKTAYLEGFAKNEYLDSLIGDIVSELTEKKNGYNTTIAEKNKLLAENAEKKSFAALSDEDKDKKLTELSEKKTELTDKNTELGDKIAALEKKIEEEQARGVDDEGNSLVDQSAIDGYNEEIEKYNEEIAANDKEVMALTEKEELYTKIKDAVGSSEAEGFEDVVKAYGEAEDEADGVAQLKEDIEAANEEIKKIDEQIKEAQGMTSATIAVAEEYISTYYGEAVSYATTENVTAEDGTTSTVDSRYGSILKKYEEKLAYAEQMVASGVDGLNTDQGENGPTRIVGTDAEIYLNGARFESNTNVFQINGLTITAQALTDEDEVISVTTATDVDGIYNMVKNFFSEYNELMKAMEEAYNAESAGDYEPLTDEEMEVMTDKQIEKWETKVKDAVLRRDSTLSSIINLMKTNMSKSFKVDGESLSLSSFGIKTLGYFNAEENERGLYHIDGDPDDSLVSGNADKLKAAIASDPDRFVSFFSQLTENLYTQLNSKMRTSTLSSAYTVYNDKYMKQQYEKYDDKISDWEDKLDAIREKYEQQFASMETALSQLQSQSSYLSSMLGY